MLIDNSIAILYLKLVIKENNFGRFVIDTSIL